MSDDEAKFSDGELPAGLKGELRAMYEPGVGFPAARDLRILAAVRAGRNRERRQWWWVSGAVAAGIAVVVGGVWVSKWGGRAGEPAAYVRTGDIRDAFYVARALEKHRVVGAGFDVNHDGVVDGADVRLLAMSAVKVDGGGK